MKRLLCTFAFAALCYGQEPVATGLYNWIHGTADADRGFAFYHEVFGIELASSPFGPPAAPGRVETIRPRAQAGSDLLVADLTNTPGAHFRNVFMGLPGAEFGFELSEFSDIEQKHLVPDLWDPGAATMKLWVRDLDATFAKAKKAGAKAVTLGGKPVKTAEGRTVFVRDPDGFLLQVIQATPAQIAKSKAEVAGAGLAVTVSDLGQSKKFYGGLLGFTIHAGKGFHGGLELYGAKSGQMRVSTSSIPGTAIPVEFYEFKGLPAKVLRLRVQDPASPQMQLRVRELDSLLGRVRSSGYKFVSVGGRPIQRAAGRFVFVEDPDGVLIEFMHPAK
jgi:catechol 2,3-dioxygenase-like lactoylglutathione lyase family enzyme